tara:strand:+ start:2915 stop:3667 length:753 start_codon:yes stop_codon:yes gene_type:complete
MATTFLTLVNDVNKRLNEVELTSSNFASTTGFYSHIKDAVNSSIRYINEQEYEWPFNHAEKQQTLTAGTTRYSFPTDTKTIDFDSFRIKESTVLGNDTKKLAVITYDEYLEKYVDQEYAATQQRALPRLVFHGPDEKYGVVQAPDQAYTLVFDYFTFADDLAAHGDTMVIPDRFKHVVINGAMYHAYMFRGNSQDALITREETDEGIKAMRSLLINRYHYMRSYMIPAATGGGRRVGSSRTTAGSSLDSL